MKRILKIVGIVFLVLFAIGFIASLSDDKKTPAQSASTVTAGTEPAKAVEPAAPSSIKVNASTIVKDYEDNEVTADNTYKDKQVIVSGIVTSIAKDIMDDPYVTLGSGQDMELTSVQCTFEKGDKSLATLHKGQKLNIQGTVTGKMMNIQLKDCSVK